jgi:methylenetetrahydrofolate dehydrogenase (NADP+)/methenyltetrahydrofolate cyclohydrolase
MAQILYAKPIVEDIVSELKDKCQELSSKGITPTLKVFLVGNHPPSLIYTRNKKRFIESFGGSCEIIHLDEKITELDFLGKFHYVV